MLVAVISDTHLEFPTPRLVNVFERYCQDADVLLHCGDCVGEAVWNYLNAHPRFFSVRGNCDLPALGDVPLLRELDLEGFRIGMGHGWGPRSRIGDTVAEQFEQPDIVCYGHTHLRDWQCRDGVWRLNPGSLFWPRSGPEGMAYLILKKGAQPALRWVDI